MKTIIEKIKSFFSEEEKKIAPDWEKIINRIKEKATEKNDEKI